MRPTRISSRPAWGSPASPPPPPLALPLLAAAFLAFFASLAALDAARLASSSLLSSFPPPAAPTAPAPSPPAPPLVVVGATGDGAAEPVTRVNSSIHSSRYFAAEQSSLLAGGSAHGFTPAPFISDIHPSTYSMAADMILCALPLAFLILEERFKIRSRYFLSITL